MLERLKRTETAKTVFYELWRRESRNSLEIRTSILGLVDSLKHRGLTTAILSNTERVLTEVDFHDTSFPVNLFDHILYSSDIGSEKPNPEIFKKALAEMGLTSKECIYIGDNFEHDVMGPSSVGMRAIWLNNHGAPVPELPPTCLGVIDRGDEISILGLIDNAQRQ